MTEDEILEITKIYSIAGLLNGKKQLVLERPSAARTIRYRQAH